MKPIYMHKFQSKDDIANEFGINHEELEGVDILLAYYHIGDYGCDSSAFVLFETEGHLFEVNGSHCSCHGLSEQGYSGGGPSQWEPEEVTVEALEHRATKGSLGDVGGYDYEGYHKESMQVIEYLKSR